MEHVISALNDLKSCKLGKEYDDTLKQLDRFSKKLTLSTLPANATSDIVSLLRKKLPHIYAKTSVGLRYSNALLAFLCSAKVQNTDADAGAWLTIADSLLSGLADFIEEADQSSKKEHQKDVLGTHITTLCAHFFVSSGQPTLHLDAHLLSTGYQVLFQIADGNPQTPTQLRKDIGGRSLGLTLTKLRGFLAIESLLNLVAALIPPRKRGIEKRNQFIDELFAPTIFPCGSQVTSMLKKDSNLEWDSIATKIIQHLGDDDVARPQPFDLSGLKVNGEESSHVAPSYIDHKGFLINVEKGDNLETLFIPFTIVKKVEAAQNTADKISITLNLDEAPTLGSQTCQHDAPMVSWDLGREHLAKFRKTLGIRGLEFRVSPQRTAKKISKVEEVDLGFKFSDLGLDQPVASQVKKISQTWASGTNRSTGIPTSSPLKATTPAPFLDPSSDKENRGIDGGVTLSPITPITSFSQRSSSPPIKARHKFSTKPNGGARRKLIVESDEEGPTTPTKAPHVVKRETETEQRPLEEPNDHPIEPQKPVSRSRPRPRMVVKTPTPTHAQDKTALVTLEELDLKTIADDRLEKENTTTKTSEAVVKKRGFEQASVEPILAAPEARPAKRTRSRTTEAARQPGPGSPSNPVLRHTDLRSDDVKTQAPPKKVAGQVKPGPRPTLPAKEKTGAVVNKSIKLEQRDDVIVISDDEEQPPKPALLPKQAKLKKTNELPWMKAEFIPKASVPDPVPRVDPRAPVDDVYQKETEPEVIEPVEAVNLLASHRQEPTRTQEKKPDDQPFGEGTRIAYTPVSEARPKPIIMPPVRRDVDTGHGARRVGETEQAFVGSPPVVESNRPRLSWQMDLKPNKDSPRAQGTLNLHSEGFAVPKRVAQTAPAPRSRGFVPIEEDVDVEPDRPKTPELTAMDRIAEVLGEINKVVLERIEAPRDSMRREFSAGQLLVLNETRQRMEDMFRKSASQFNELIDLEREYVSQIDDVTSGVSDIGREGAAVHDVFKQIVDHHNRHSLSKRAPKSLVPPLPAVLRKV